MSIEATLAWLETAGLEDIRGEWRRRYGAPPRLRSDTLLRSALAWKIQSDAFGRLDDTTRKLLQSTAGPRDPVARAGTIVAREWLGVRHEVEVLGDAFLYRGKKWRSLSEIARAITGTRWNGPLFFGLREQRK